MARMPVGLSFPIPLEGRVSLYTRETATPEATSRGLSNRQNSNWVVSQPPLELGDHSGLSVAEPSFRLGFGLNAAGCTNLGYA